ncbi:hypothetical protein DJ69_13210 [Halorubrum persicum]|uniref:DUF8009 domain-containing protein n=1 Tax=Halorubrum persicum TaxID=1383844 RepID=A0A2G1WGP4_9EURY|nr:hypothetical protein [Halorubrum persicum]PHQ38125.1 hypothetical protein DJ69_13210 [Halorubrum persicum]
MTDGDRSASTGPTRIRSIAVHRDDVATALEATLRSDREVVLRVTPPFSGRMRARLHSLGTGATAGADTEAGEGDETAGDADPIHIDPRALVSGVPAYPEVDETMANNPDADVETRRERHTAAVESWREAVRGSVVDSVALDAGGDGDNGGGAPIEVDVAALG